MFEVTGADGQWRSGLALLLACGCGSETIEGNTTVIVNPPEDVVLDGGGAVPAPPNGEALCPPGPCNYQTGAGCAEQEACRPAIVAGDQLEPRCQPAGSAADGDPCVEWTDCGPGLLCATGVCRRLCCGDDWSACEPDQSCFRDLLVGIGDAGVPAGVGVCTPVDDCSVLDPEACQDLPGGGCALVDPRGKQACVLNAVAEAGDACSEARRCSTGLACLGGLCRRLCRAEVGGEPGCARHEGTCVHFRRDPPGVGECTPLTE